VSNVCLTVGGGWLDAGVVRTRAAAHCGQGWAAQIDPIKPKLKPPGTKRLKLEYDGLLSNSAFKFNLRRYTKAFAAASRINITVRSFKPDSEAVTGVKSTR